MGQLHGPSQRDQSAPRKPFSGLFLPVPSEPLHFIDHFKQKYERNIGKSTSLPQK